MDSDSSITSLSFSDNSLPEFESFSDHTKETRSDSTTTHANYSFPEFESFHFNPSLPRPPPEPPDVCLDILYNNESFEPGEGENIVVSKVEEDNPSHLPSVHFYHFSLIPRFLLYLAQPGVKISFLIPTSSHFLKPLAFLWKFLSSIFALPKDN
ncbi:hypothetical protein Tco_1312552 [Tanacetum coccineum]